MFLLRPRLGSVCSSMSQMLKSSPIMYSLMLPMSLDLTSHAFTTAASSLMRHSWNASRIALWTSWLREYAKKSTSVSMILRSRILSRVTELPNSSSAETRSMAESRGSPTKRRVPTASFAGRSAMIFGSRSATASSNAYIGFFIPLDWTLISMRILTHALNTKSWQYRFTASLLPSSNTTSSMRMSGSGFLASEMLGPLSTPQRRRIDSSVSVIVRMASTADCALCSASCAEVVGAFMRSKISASRL
mmetsp:Transcript_20020/g.49658  ORF Transcript_20020/g.49658 Transcript_20020/m.49658 type:complete len:247 (-) Transcript_20020:12-752(-)